MSTESTSRLSIQEFIDSTTMSPRQRLIVALGLLTMIAEGLDVTIAGFVYPHVVRDWGTSIGAVTATVTSGVLSMAAGGAVAGPLADRYGRKGVTVVGVLIFGLATAAMGLATSIEVLAILRAVACAGLGAVAPAVMTVIADSTPAHRRAQMVTLTFSGVAVGTVGGGFLASAVIPAYGWPALLALCGLAPLLLVPFVVAYVPESVSVLIARGRDPEQVRKVLALLAPDRDTSRVDLSGAPVGERGQSVGAIVLSRAHVRRTLLIWLCSFILLGVVFLILNYLPLMVEQSGLSAARTGTVVGFFGWGSLGGQLLASFGVKRFDRFRVLALASALSAVAVWVMSVGGYSFPGLLAVVFALGLVLGGSTSSLQAVGALAYPSAARATGLGWMSGVGRLGTLTSGLLGGIMIGAGWGISRIFLVLGVPLLLGALAALLLGARPRRPALSPQP
ncbi:MFS transporter [Streptomyces sp. NPDC048430]|uniref:MFS transporter n=1 Tax=Streptomyces sp. NPDC048430 TaxID=3155388 RepID=UPI003423365F